MSTLCILRVRLTLDGCSGYFRVPCLSNRTHCQALQSPGNGFFQFVGCESHPGRRQDHLFVSHRVTDLREACVVCAAVVVPAEPAQGAPSLPAPHARRGLLLSFCRDAEMPRGLVKDSPLITVHTPSGSRPGPGPAPVDGGELLMTHSGVPGTSHSC